MSTEMNNIYFELCGYGNNLSFCLYSKIGSLDVDA